MKRAFLVACAAAFLCGAVLCAEGRRALEDIFPHETCEALRKEGGIQRSAFGGGEEASCEYLPEGPLAASVRDYWTAGACDYTSEALFLYKKEAGAAALSAEESGNIIEEILKSISRLEGTTYFSNSRQEERTLYARAFRVSDAESKAPLPDPVAEETDGLSALVLLEDLTFGENLYAFSYRKNGAQASLSFTNETPLKFLAFTGIKPGDLKSTLLVEDLGDELLIYGLVRANYLSVPGIRGRIDASLSSRMEAMYKWFVSFYEELT